MGLVNKSVLVDISYYVGKQDPSGGVYDVEVPEPEWMEELRVNVSPGLDFDFERDDWVPNGKTQLDIRGSRRAYESVARYLLALCHLETLDPDYHDHFDDLSDVSDRRYDLIVHAPHD